MLPRERVIEVIERRRPDRIPIYGWVSANIGGPVAEAFGSVAAFEDQYEFDFAHVFGGPGAHSAEILEGIGTGDGGAIEPGDLRDVVLCDPNDDAAYDGIRQAIDHHKTQRGRFVYVQTPGIFECLNGVFGIEKHLLYLALYESDLHEVYRRQAEWNRAFAMNCLDLGIDMIHVSDDWGAQNGLMFSPAVWQRMIYPYHKVTCDAVRARNGYVSLHSDGNINDVLDGVVQLGYHVVHPYQESAGMSLEDYQRDRSASFAVMGGLDVQNTIGFGDFDTLRRQINRVLTMFADTGILFCTTHFVQDHCTIEELTFAYDLVYDRVRQLGRG